MFCICPPPPNLKTLATPMSPGQVNISENNIPGYLTTTVVEKIKLFFKPSGYDTLSEMYLTCVYLVFLYRCLLGQVIFVTYCYLTII